MNVLAFGMIALSLVSASLAGPPDPPDPTAVFAKTWPTAAPILYFITAEQLSRLASLKSSEARTLPYASLDVLAQARQAKAAFARSGCTGPLEGDTESTDQPKPEEFAEWPFRRKPVAFLGRVEKLAPGWALEPAAPETGLVHTLVTVTVTEVLRDEANHLSPGSRVSFLEQQIGSFTFEGVTFCTRNPELVAVSIGNTVAVSGEWGEANGRDVLDNASILIVTGTRAIPTVRTVSGVTLAPVDLDRLRAAAADDSARGD